MLIVIPTNNGDLDLAFTQAKLIKALGGVSAYKAKIIAGPETSDYKLSQLRDLLSESFASVSLNKVQVREHRLPLENTTTPWSRQANDMFIGTVKVLKEEGNNSPWLYLHPDATPIAKDWLVSLDREYLIAKGENKDFLGSVLPLKQYSYVLDNTTQKGFPARVLHKITSDEKETYSPSPLVLPAGFEHFSQLYVNSKLVNWEIKCRWELESKIQHTKSIKHAPRTRDYKFVEGSNGTKVTFTVPSVDTTTPDLIDITGVKIIHGCRDNSLAELILNSLSKGSTSHKPEPVDVKPIQTQDFVEEIPTSNPVQSFTPVKPKPKSKKKSKSKAKPKSVKPVDSLKEEVVDSFIKDEPIETNQTI